MLLPRSTYCIFKFSDALPAPFQPSKFFSRSAGLEGGGDIRNRCRLVHTYSFCLVGMNVAAVCLQTDYLPMPGFPETKVENQPPPPPASLKQ